MKKIIKIIIGVTLALMLLAIMADAKTFCSVVYAMMERMAPKDWGFYDIPIYTPASKFWLSNILRGMMLTIPYWIILTIVLFIHNIKTSNKKKSL
ncbi:MAG: hypothetical protein LKG25_09015 [Prevotella sp.]|jgi:hypothetical protein|nr:hypothetical protein [Prevotella sp.]MCI1282714.1 hypothetical protein [Prevotella sp.]